MKLLLNILPKNKTIPGGGQYITSFTYNSAGLPVTMTYPDDEVVTFTYNNQMLLESMAGTSTYVSSTVYDSASRMTSRMLGNGLTQNYTCYAWNQQGGRLQALSTGSLQNFTYDALDRLVTAGATGTSQQGGYATETYSYDSTTGNLSSKAGVNYTYDTTHKHAVASLSNGNSYSYDANGNMTQRNADGKSYTFTYDADNRLVAVSGDSTALFMYDADGARVKSVMDGETTYFVGGHYEITNPGAGQTVTKYYIAGVTRVALRKNGTLSYMLADHLGSTSLVTDANGNRTSELRYMPWGAPRFSFGTMPTKYTFTGQFGYTDDPSTPGNEGFGLMYFGARWYDVSLGRFAQADTVIPKGVQGYDRYAYANNAPVKYVDPSGHSPVADTDAATTTPSCSETDNTGELVYRYCDLSNGARLDYSHFQAGVEDWQAVLKAWENDKKSVWVTNSFGGKDFSLKFSLEGIESVDDLRTAFISWYAKDYQIQFETFQGQNGGLKGKASSFNTEDIPSMVLGVTMASYFGKKADPKTLYTATIWLLGGGKGSNKDDHTGPRNSSWFLMTPTGTKLPYPSSSEGRFGLGILNDL